MAMAYAHAAYVARSSTRSVASVNSMGRLTMGRRPAVALATGPAVVGRSRLLMA